MIRTNVFKIKPRTNADEELLRKIMDASAALWNQLTYDRRQRLAAGDDILDGDRFYDEYKSVLGSAITQVMARWNDETWRGFIAKQNDASVQPPGYWGNTDEGRELRTAIRNTMYTIQWGTYSRLEIPAGSDLKSEYGLGWNDRLRLPIYGCPKWDGSKGRLTLIHNSHTDTFWGYQAVRIDEESLPEPTGNGEAALDLGVNNLVACVTTDGHQLLYDGQEPFDEFQRMTRRIADAKSKLPEGTKTSKRVRRFYRTRTRRRNHAVNTLIRSLLERLYEDEVSKVYVGDLTNVLQSKRTGIANTKTHNFWAFRKFLNQLESVCEELGLTLESISEAWSSQTCPDCGSTSRTVRIRDRLTCSCGFTGHADLSAAQTLLEWNSNDKVGSMARPVRFQWDSHKWRPNGHH